MAEKILSNPKIAEGIAKQHPLKRVGEGSDSAALAKFLLSDESSWITDKLLASMVEDLTLDKIFNLVFVFLYSVFLK